MNILSNDELSLVSGGVNTSGLRESNNVIDQRGNDKGNYIDANGKCWAPGTPSNVMYPSGGGKPWKENSGTSDAYNYAKGRPCFFDPHNDNDVCY